MSKAEATRFWFCLSGFALTVVGVAITFSAMVGDPGCSAVSIFTTIESILMACCGGVMVVFGTVLFSEGYP